MQYLVSLIAGLLFGAGMMLSGMVDPQKVIGFLDVFGQWDPTLAFVMGGALLVFTPGYWFIVHKRQSPVYGEKFNLPVSTVVDRKLLVGAMLFGLGWGLAGICPGPAVTSLSGMEPAILWFILAMLVGMKLVTLGRRQREKAI